MSVGRERELSRRLAELEELEPDFYAGVMVRVIERLFPDKSVEDIVGAVLWAYREEQAREEEAL